MNIHAIDYEYLFFCRLGDESQAKSHDEYRLLENDAFIKNLKRKEEQEIVKQTTAEMFDLSQLDYHNEDELEEKEQFYREMHSKLNFGTHKPFSLLKFKMTGREIKIDENCINDANLDDFDSKVKMLSDSLSSVGIRNSESLVCN